MTAGAATLNPTGINQFSAAGAAGVRKRIDAAIANAVTQRPECITSFAEKFADALEDPEGHLQFLYLCKDRIAALLPADGDAAGNDPVAARASADQLLRLAEGARRAIPADTRLALSAVCESPGRTSEAD